MFRSLIEEIRDLIEDAKRPGPWKRPPEHVLQANEKKLRDMGMTSTTKKKVLVRGPFGAPEQPIRTGKPHSS